VLIVADVLRSGEQHVLEEMREPRAAGSLVLRAHVVPDVDCDERSGVIFVQDDAETVREAVVL
jgi:hypothetical protein